MLNITIGAREGFHGSGAETPFLNATKESLLGFVDGEVRIEAVHSRQVVLANIPNDGVFRIYVWAFYDTYKETLQFKAGSLWGHTDFCRDALYKPYEGATEHIDIIAPEGDTVAQYFPKKRALVMLIDATHTASANSKDIYKAILDDVVLLINAAAGGKTAEEIAAIRKKAQEEQRIKNIAAMLDRLAKTRLANSQSRLSGITTNIDNYKRELIKLGREQVALMVELKALESANGEANAKVLREFERIAGMKHVVSYDITGTDLVFTTDTIVAEVNGKLYLMGKYSVSVNIETCNVKIMNLTPENRRKSYWGQGCQHPHVSNTGSPCLGNIVNTIADLVVQNEWCGLVNLMLGYLKAINLDDIAGQNYYMWDEVEEQGDGTYKVVKKGGSRTLTCSVCGSEIDEGDSTTCADCDAVLCDDCAKSVDGDNRTVCESCRDENYRQCSRCGGWYYYDSGSLYTCEECGETVCGGCCTTDDDAHIFCNATCRKKYSDKHAEPDTTPEAVMEAADAVRAEAALTAEPCPICTRPTPDAMLYTCEVCGRQGCINCIEPVTRSNGRTLYTCNEHREG
jgi:hypothetical protein